VGDSANVATRKAQAAKALTLMVWISVVPPLPLSGLSLIIERPWTDLVALAGLSLRRICALAYMSYLSTPVALGLWGWLMRR
jgi:O-acetylserine/cysteine efflux transporter